MEQYQEVASCSFDSCSNPSALLIYAKLPLPRVEHSWRPKQTQKARLNQQL